MPVARSVTRLEREIRVEAAPETVFAFFTDPERMVRWMGDSATLDPRPGGVFAVEFASGMVIAGEFMEVVPHRRVVFTWGYGDPIPPGSSIVEIELVPDGDATIVRLVHRDLPEEVRAFHELGWELYLARLEIAGGGDDPGPDPAAEIAGMSI